MPNTNWVPAVSKLTFSFLILIGSLPPALADSPIAASRSHSVMLTRGEYVCAGGNFEAGALTQTRDNGTVPGPAALLNGAQAVAAGWNHSLAAGIDGRVWSWGDNSFGQLGDGGTYSRSAPLQVEGLSGVMAVAAGKYHSLALKSDGTVWAWGFNGNGQLGDGTTAQRLSPVQVSQLTGITAISAGAEFSLALRGDGTVWSWGKLAGSQSPVPVTGLSDVIAIAAGSRHALALRHDGSVWAWGSGARGELGNGVIADSSSPVPVTGLAGITALAAGGAHNLAVTAEGAVWAWGANGSGQLGDGTVVQRSVPVQVQGLDGLPAATYAAAGEDYSAVLLSDGTIRSWGDNSRGQLGDGATTASLTPVLTQSCGSSEYGFPAKEASTPSASAKAAPERASSSPVIRLNDVGTPSVVSVSPSSGTGSAQVFTAVYADTAGASTLTNRAFLINSSLGGVSACYVVVNMSGIYLVTDAGNLPANTIPANGTASNSQCTVNGSGTSVVNSGNMSTFTVSLSFFPSFAGTKNIYMLAADANSNSGWNAEGTYTVTGSSAPTTVSVAPSSGSGLSQTFTAVYSNPAGASMLNHRLLLINTAIYGAGACYVQADNTGFYLVNDAGNALLGPAGTSTLSNSQCTLSGSGSSISNSGTTSTVTLFLTFNNSFVGAKNVYLYDDDTVGNVSGWQARGTYTVTAGTLATPTADSVSPSSGTGVNQTFTAVFSDASGAALLKRRLFLMNSTLSGASACFVQVDPTGTYLVNDAGTSIGNPVGSGGSASNSQCTLNGAGSSVVTSGTTSTVTLSLTFAPSFGGTKNIYLYDEDTNGNNSGFQQRGTFTIGSASSVPTNVSISPSSGSGTTQTFTVVYSDAAGNSLLNRRLLLINSAIYGGSACYVQVDNSGIHLVNDAGNGVSPALTPGGSASNSQCTLSPSGGASVSYSSTSTTVVLPITFSPSFGGTRNLYMYADDIYGNNSGWQQKGTITTQ